MDAACWVLGGEFEDSVFERRPERRPAPPAPSGAKRCEPQWFYEETESSDDVEVLTIKKFRGDLAYRRQEYQKALQEFSSISEKLSPTNFAMKRDVQEGQARCLAHLGRHVEALEIAAALESKATNTDHLTTVLYLQSAICSSLCNLENIIFCLQKLICLHPLDPWSWQKLAEAYLDLGLDLSASHASLQGQDSFISDHKSVRPSAPYSVFPTGANSSGSQKGENISKNTQSYAEGQTKTAWLDVQMKACASLIRTRLLLQLAQSQQTSFALERNLRIQQEVEDKVKRLGFSEDTLLLITEMMGEDIVPEKIKEDVHSEVKCVGPAALAALVTASSKEFEDKWFGKIKDHFCPLEHQFCTEILILP